MAYSEAQNKATQRYIKKNYDRITLRCEKGKREKYQELAKERGMSLNQLIISILENELHNDRTQGT